MAGDAYYDKVSLLLHFDGPADSTSFVDRSPQARTVTSNGGAALSTAKYKLGGSSLYLNGTQWLSVSGTTTNCKTLFTLEAVICPTAAPASGSSARVLSAQDVNSPNAVIAMRIDSAGALHFIMRPSAGGTLFDLASAAGAIKTDGSTFYTVAVTRDANNRVDLWINGVSVANGTSSYDPTGTAAWVIGTYNGGEMFTGYIDEMRITPTVCRYAGNYAPATAAFPDGMAQVSGTVTDAAGAAAERAVSVYSRGTGALIASVFSGPGDASFNSVALLLTAAGGGISDKSPARKVNPTISGVVTKGDQRKFYGAAMYFDGNDANSISFPHQPDYSAAGKLFTVEAIVRPTIMGRLLVIATKRPTGSGAIASEWELFIDGTTGKLRFIAWDTSGTGSASVNMTGTTVLAANAWAEVAAARDAAGTWRMFVNGNLEATAAETAPILTNTSALLVGTDSVAGRAFQGYIEALRVTRGVVRYTAAYAARTNRYPESITGSVGSFSAYTPTLDEVNIICLDDDAGTTENDKVLRALPA